MCADHLSLTKTPFRYLNFMGKVVGKLGIAPKPYSL